MHYRVLMLLRRAELDAIVAGKRRYVFRRWKRATVRAGGTLKTVVGVLAIDSLEKRSLASITAADAKSAGFASRAALLDELRKREGDVYRVGLSYAGEDPRIALRKQARVTAAERDELRVKLERMDKRSAHGPWTARVLARIDKSPGKRAADLAEQLGYEKAWFKTNVRKLKALGLTESLEVGYRISGRGRAFLAKKR